MAFAKTKSLMAQFDVFDNPVVSMRREQPYLLEVQSDLLGAMLTTVVIPLVLGASVVRFERLMPALQFKGLDLRISTPGLFSLPRPALGRPLGNLSMHRDAIVAALDHLILGL